MPEKIKFKTIKRLKGHLKWQATILSGKKPTTIQTEGFFYVYLLKYVFYVFYYYYYLSSIFG